MFYALDWFVYYDDICILFILKLKLYIVNTLLH